MSQHPFKRYLGWFLSLFMSLSGFMSMSAPEQSTCEPPVCDPEIPLGIEFAVGDDPPPCPPAGCDPQLPSGIEFMVHSSDGEGGEFLIDW